MSWKYDALRSIFDDLRGVSSGDETLSNAWYYFSNKMVLEEEIKVSKLSSFSSHFKTLTNISFVFSLWVIEKFEKEIWKNGTRDDRRMFASAKGKQQK